MDATRFKQLFLPCHRKLYGVALRLLENEDDAADMVQEAYLKLWDKRDMLDHIDNPEAFCTTLLRNLCLDLLRSGQYQWNRQQMPLADNMPLATPDFSVAQDEAQDVRSLIACLPEQQRRIVCLRDLRGCSYEEIGKLTGLNAVNIRVALSRGRKKIKELFLKRHGYEKRRD